MAAKEILGLQTLWEMGVFSYGQIELHFHSVFFFLGWGSRKACIIFLLEAQFSYGNVRFG